MLGACSTFSWRRWDSLVSLILTLTEDKASPWLIPTKQNILSAMTWLAPGCKSGDSLVFHFSGHGLRQRDECLCPVDFKVLDRERYSATTSVPSLCDLFPTGPNCMPSSTRVTAAPCSTFPFYFG
ncbi:hypothetical protein MLD38_013687 [Melastoma candidum]|uniref:Uncharacterized protein n=1 Tax=Melastoma candidum TaxID=119954 RepID=A0ACB9RAC9_9MYRT|nr:hypothetical protein MLD38_013687 [Melastoma candidum]